MSVFVERHCSETDFCSEICRRANPERYAAHCAFPLTVPGILAGFSSTTQSTAQPVQGYWNYRKKNSHSAIAERSRGQELHAEVRALSNLHRLSDWNRSEYILFSNIVDRSVDGNALPSLPNLSSERDSALRVYSTYIMYVVAYTDAHTIIAFSNNYLRRSRQTTTATARCAWRLPNGSRTAGPGARTRSTGSPKSSARDRLTRCTRNRRNWIGPLAVWSAWTRKTFRSAARNTLAREFKKCARTAIITRYCSV